MPILATGGNANAAGIQLSQTGYRIVVGSESSEEFDFGTPAEWQGPDGLYLAFIDVAGGEQAGDKEIEADGVETRFEHWLYKATPVECEPEDLEDDGDGGGDANDDDGDVGDGDGDVGDGGGSGAL